MKKNRYAGRHLLRWGAVLLLAWSGYQFIIRLDTMWWALKGVYNLCMVEQIPFMRAITYFDPSMFHLVAYLVCAIFGALFVLLFANKPGAGFFSLLIALGLCVYGRMKLNMFNVFAQPINWLQMLELIPILLIIAGCIINWAHAVAMLNRRESYDEEEIYVDPRVHAKRQSREMHEVSQRERSPRPSNRQSVQPQRRKSTSSSTQRPPRRTAQPARKPRHDEYEDDYDEYEHATPVRRRRTTAR